MSSFIFFIPISGFEVNRGGLSSPRSATRLQMSFWERGTAETGARAGASRGCVEHSFGGIFPVAALCRGRFARTQRGGSEYGLPPFCFGTDAGLQPAPT
jgi:hypothetical protein